MSAEPIMHETVAKINQQVIGLERGYDSLRQEVMAIDQKMEHGFSAVDQKMASGFAVVDQKLTSSFSAIANKLDQKTSPQWQAYGVMVSVVIAIIGALFYPVRENTAKHDAAIDSLRSQTVPRVELDRILKEQANADRMNEERLLRLSDQVSKIDREVGFVQGQRSHGLR